MTHILGLRALADFIEKSDRFNQGSGHSCTIGHAFRLAGQPSYASDTSSIYTIDRAASLLGIPPSEALKIWGGDYPNMKPGYDPRPTQIIAVEHLRQLADRYEPASPIDAKPMAAPSPTEAQPMPLLVLERELVPA
jgi:hypothetical protein